MSLKTFNLNGEDEIRKWFETNSNRWAFDDYKRVQTIETWNSKKQTTLSAFVREEPIEDLPKSLVETIRESLSRRRYLAVILPIRLFWKIEKAIDIVPDYILGDSLQVNANHAFYDVLCKSYPEEIFIGTLDDVFLMKVFLGMMDDEEKYNFVSQTPEMKFVREAAALIYEETDDVAGFLKFYNLYEEIVKKSHNKNS